MTFALGAAALIAWIYLLLGRGLFWLTRERDDRGPQPEDPAVWPSVAVVVPARNEADVIARSLGSLVAQDYPGAFRVILVDDGSTDGTAAAAPSSELLEVRIGAALPTGWTGKLWAVSQGVEHASRGVAPPDYILLTDADIAHAPDNLRALVARAEAGQLVLTSLMAKLAVETWADRMMIPAFVFFFDMLFPFAWVNDAARKTAAAAGGCMLVRRNALERAGGIAAIRREIIDDCALGALMKRQGPIWLGLTERARSLRPYGDIGEIGRMISRSAYAQLMFLALAAGWDPDRAVPGLSRRPGARPRSRRIAPRAGRAGLAGHDRGLPTHVAILSALAAVGSRLARDRWGLRGVHAEVGHRRLARARRTVEGPGAGDDGKRRVNEQVGLASGKGAADENFPVASRLVAPRHRDVVMRFYAVARMADDIADHAMLSPARKLELLDGIEATLDGGDAVPEAATLRDALAARALTDRHIRDLLVAFRRDAVQNRYGDWADLMDYCLHSAAPVGRFMLDVHGESRDTWPASDALCAALQVINHLQDCAKDYGELDRVYIPLDALAATGAEVDDLGEARSTPGLLTTIRALAARTARLLAESKALAPAVRDTRLALEIGVIQALAESLTGRLMRRDPLADRVHHTRDAALGVAAWGAITTLVWRLGSRQGRRGSGIGSVRWTRPHRTPAGDLEAKVSGSSFYTALRILPKRERDAMFAIYGFCREVDDIADEPGRSPPEQIAALDGWRADVHALYSGETRPNTRSLTGPVADFHLAQDDFQAVIDGMAMDVGPPIRAPDFHTFDLYCDRVASAVGRLSVRVFGMEEHHGRQLAHHLGRALQFTNVLRDLDEDAAMGRLYLPADALDAAGIESRDPVQVIADPRIDVACRWLAARAREHYRKADFLMKSGVKGRLRAPRLMSAVYGAILRGMERVGWAAPRARVSLGKGYLIWLAVRHGLPG